MKNLFIIGATLLIAALVVGGVSAQEDPLAKYKNLALGKTVVVNAFTQVYKGANAVDGNVGTYWEGKAKAYPNIITVDLAAVRTMYGLRIKLNPQRIWQPRTQTFTVEVSNDGNAFTVLAPSKVYSFHPVQNANTVTVPFDGAKARFVRITFTANTGAPGGQIAELEIYGE